jgi:hypothetical protein
MSRDDGVKATLTLSRKSGEFLKREARYPGIGLG